MMKTNLLSWLAGAAAFGLAAGAMAAPYSVKYVDTVSTASVLGITNGQQATIELILDNGNSSVASQTWSAANVTCVTFKFNNAQNLFVAINYSGVPFTFGTTGNFTTNGAGVLQTVPSSWIDFSPFVGNPVVTNIAGSTPLSGMWINANNNVLFLSPSQVGFTNVANDIIAANWSNPVPSNGNCSGASGPPAAASSIPTLTEWSLLMLAGLLALGAVFALRRQRQ
jgi:hypothetical protein